MRRKILFRADGNTEIGLGHVYRTIALAQILKDNLRCSFYIREPSPAIVRLLRNERFELTCLSEKHTYEEEALFFAQSVLNGDEVVVLDGYPFSTSYQQILKGRCSKLVCIDDINKYKFVSDLVINHVIGVNADDIISCHQTQKKVGPDFAILRKEFLVEAINKNHVEMNDLKFFISMGGADLYNATEQVLESLFEKFPSSQFKILLGSAYKGELAEKFRVVDKVHTYRDLSASDIIRVIKECNIAICPASTIAYEAFCVNIPVITGYISDNQKYVATNFDEFGIAVNVGDLRNPGNSLIGAVGKVLSTYLSMMKSQKKFFYGQQLNNLLNAFSS